MPKYRKLPVEIEAWQFKIVSPIRYEELGEYIEAPKWLDDALSGSLLHNCKASLELSHPDGPRIAISTLEGVMIALLGDYIIQGVKGELYPCKPDIFEATYEEVEKVPSHVDPRPMD